MLCADMDSPTFDQSIGSFIADELLTEFNASYTDLPDSIGKDLLLKRKQLAVGKNLFFIRILDFDQIKHDQEKIRESTRALHDRMRKKCGPRVTTRISHASTSIAFAFGKIGQAIENFERSGTLPFILHNNRLGQKFDLLINESIGFLHITDEPDNPANQAKKFAEVTEAISNFSDWKFDAGAAVDYLSKVKSDLTAKEGIEPW